VETDSVAQTQLLSSIPKFDVSDISKLLENDSFSMICYGQKASGKTTCIISVLKHFDRLFDTIYLFSITYDNIKKYQSEFNINDTFGGFTDENTELFIEKLIKFQQLTNEKYNKQKKILLIFDDVIDMNRKLHSSQVLGSLFSNHRHYNINIVISVQSPTQISPLVRQNSNYSFICFSKNKRVKDIIYQECMSNLSKEQFEKTFNITSLFNILVIEPLKKNDDIHYYNAMKE